MQPKRLYWRPVNNGLIFCQAFILEKENIPTEEQLLYASGKPLSDDSALISTVVECGIIDVNVGVRGGNIIIISEYDYYVGMKCIEKSNDCYR